MNNLARKIAIIFLFFCLSIIEFKSPYTNTITKNAYEKFIFNVLKGNFNQDFEQNSYLKKVADKNQNFASKNPQKCQPNHSQPNFLAIGGGGASSYNEIALEKNILYFERTLKQMGYDPASATILFANGNNGQATVRYLDQQGQEQFKVPKIPHLKAAATLENFQIWLQQTANQASNRPIFFYFTGHGSLNRENSENNALILWHEQLLTVNQLANLLNKLPQNNQIVTMMAQCYAGSFANFIYQNGIPGQAVALQTRCGFFATISTKPSVGCTPQVNEADYQDYSSSFFAGLSGVNRIGNPVPSADYNRDGHVSYAEAHAFAKVDEKTTDLPVSTVEVWLQRQITKADLDRFLNQPITNLRSSARPQQRYVIDSLVKQFNFNPSLSYWDNFNQLSANQMATEEQKAYQIRLTMELVNIGMEQQIRTQQKQSAIAILDRLIQCEASSWR